VPFVLVLHGYGGNGASFARYFRLHKLAEKSGFIYVAPDGTPDRHGNRFWNAGAACCDFDHTNTDHVATLGKIIEQARSAPRVDPSRVYVVGYSNGAFMAHRLGCDVAGVRGILSVAGAGVRDTAACAHAPERVIEVHGDVDTAVPFAGGNVLSRNDVEPHAGALETATAWATKKGCTLPASLIGHIDLEEALPGAETERFQFSCAPGVTLLKVAGGTHGLAASEAAIAQLLADLMR